MKELEKFIEKNFSFYNFRFIRIIRPHPNSRYDLKNILKKDTMRISEKLRGKKNWKNLSKKKNIINSFIIFVLFESEFSIR